jgi:hypothetical protein
MTLKKIFRYLIDNHVIFTALQVRRFKKKYPPKILNDNYNTDLPSIHFIHRYLTTNTGDKACGYYQYFFQEFESYTCIVHDVNYVNLSLIKKTDVVIIGGGGLLNATAEWNYNINRAARKAAKAIIWSAGFNSNINQKRYNINFDLFDIVAVRDYNYKTFRYVPCATCFMPLLYNNYSIKREIGVVAHKDVPQHIPSEINKYEKVTNSDSLEKMVEFIGASNVILTNSYHAVYWSVLLKKKCVLFAPRSEKYNYYKYPPTLFSGDLESDIARAVIYPNALEDSRQLTLELLNDIKSEIKALTIKN